MQVAVGAKKGARVINVNCGGIGCESDHQTYDCKDVALLLEGMDLNEANENEALRNCLADGRMMATATRAYPTMLGIWWEAVCDN